ncbi:aspartate aminotransferase family protein [Bacillus sp. MUM 13]|uniref:aspartate aminotransferase family protein n=1 Tax=Bacillus sp. MUM 13 TaxID=1678001 RepID=UPI0008F55DAB|nr:aspartate aminotransferase family protein [Bacillus sp. MUM 13]OIK09487.1 aspartate aminotransferase family protein [Bacillus sp. MUM 13]
MKQQSSLIKPVLDAGYPTISHGKGVYLYDHEGKDYLDASSGAVTANIGHGVEEIAAAMAEQAKKVSFVYRSQFTSDAAENLAAKISEMTDGKMPWSFFVNSGSEATETAMKIAIQHWQEKGKPQKSRIISRWMSYHGITMGALSMSGYQQRRERFTEYLESFPSVPPPYCYRCPLGMEALTCGMACAKELESSIRRIGEDHVAAFIAEPVIGAAGGAISPPEGYFQEIKRICRKYNILFIADEVMTGFGRTGKTLACDHWDACPDIMVFGKGMSGGYTPIAAAVMADHVIQPILQGSKSIMGGHTFSANPQSCAVSLAVLEYVEKHDVASKAAASGIFLKQALKKTAENHTFIGDVRGKGLLLGIEFVKNKRTKEPFLRSAEVTNTFISLAQKNGLLLYPAASGHDGVTGSAVMIAPPLTITEAEMNDLLFRLDLTFADFTNEALPGFMESD